MSNVTKNAIVRALVEGAITELMIKTKTDNVYIDDTTTLSAKLSEIITAINARAKSTDVTNQINTAINNLIDGAPNTYDTLKEISDYISSHQDVVTSINNAIGNKADRTTFEAVKAVVDALGSLASKNVISENDLDSSLKSKINNGVSGNHTHDNKSLLDTYDQTNDSLKDAVSKKHSHSNMAVLNGITSALVTEWNSKGTTFVSATEPSGLATGDLWIAVIE